MGYLAQQDTDNLRTGLTGQTARAPVVPPLTTVLVVYTALHKPDAISFFVSTVYERIRASKRKHEQTLADNRETASAAAVDLGTSGSERHGADRNVGDIRCLHARFFARIRCLRQLLRT